LKDQDFHELDTHDSSVAQMIRALGRSLKSRLRGVHGGANDGSR
jgi:hypothetical protein